MLYDFEKKYENIKKRTKQKFADEKCYRLGTGGGPEQNHVITGVDASIMEIFGEARVQGLPSQFEADIGKNI